MLIMFLAFIVAILALPCAMAPTMVWKAFTAGDELGDCEGYLDGKFVASSTSSFHFQYIHIANDTQIHR